jgi:dTDP-4-dehydrorhamnose reductase
MRILITGAAGMLGVDVGLSAAAAGHDTIALSRADLDITDGEAVRAKLHETQPDAVINCAAYTDVDGAESNVETASAINGAGAGFLAAAAREVGAWIVHVSTDYVFDGRKTTPYVESDATGPNSAYGRSKLIGERGVAQAAPGAHTIVRSAWLFGASGRCFPKTIMRLAGERDELSVVADQIGCPTFTGHLAGALVELAAGDRLGGVVHVAAGGHCSWFEFARSIVGGAGLDCEVKPCTTDEFPRPAPRPAYSVLATERGPAVPRLPDWREGLEQFLEAGVPSR